MAGCAACCRCCLRCCFNWILMLTGAALILLSFIVKKTYGEYLTFTENKYYIAANYVMYVGIFILVTSVLGCCCASMPSNRYIMALFVIFVVIVLVMDIVAGSLVLVYREKATGVADKALKRGLDKYGKEQKANAFLDWVQRDLKCCGINGPDDWKTKGGAKRNSTVSVVPASCCITEKMNSKCAMMAHNVYQAGCKDKFEGFLKGQFVLIGAFAISVAVLQILGMSCAILGMGGGGYEQV